MPALWENSLCSPCKDCPDRHTACWGHCGKYDAWTVEVRKQNKAEKEYLQMNRRDFVKSEETQWRNKKRRYR